MPPPPPELSRSVAHTVRMARVSISVPDDVVAAAKDAGVNISALATEALRDELDRRAKIAELDAYLDALEAEHGPISGEDAAKARQWVDDLVGHERAAQDA